MSGPEPTDGRRMPVSFRLPISLVEEFDNEAELRSVAANQKGKPKVSRNELVLAAMKRFAKGFK